MEEEEREVMYDIIPALSKSIFSYCRIRSPSIKKKDSQTDVEQGIEGAGGRGRMRGKKRRRIGWGEREGWEREQWRDGWKK